MEIGALDERVAMAQQPATRERWQFASYRAVVAVGPDQVFAVAGERPMVECLTANHPPQHLPLDFTGSIATGDVRDVTDYGIDLYQVGIVAASLHTKQGTTKSGDVEGNSCACQAIEGLAHEPG